MPLHDDNTFLFLTTKHNMYAGKKKKEKNQLLTSARDQRHVPSKA